MANRKDRDDYRCSGGSDVPPMSRLFIICNKSNTEDDLRKAFQSFGTIEEVSIVKDRSSGESKGIAYVKFSKTSEAAAALEEMNGKLLGELNNARPIKVLVAASRNQGSTRSDNEQEKNVRLFVIISKDINEQKLTDEFQKFGEVDSVSIIRDKSTKESKGFAYVKFFRFTHAAMAFENCDKKYKAVFAEPKANRSQDSTSSDRSSSYRSDDLTFSTQLNTSRNASSNKRSSSRDLALFMNHSASANKQGLDNNVADVEFQLSIICSDSINQDQLWRLLDIIPGLEYCQINGECGSKSNYATAAYNNKESAQYARDKIHGLEYPPGERIIIKYSGEIKSNIDCRQPVDEKSRDSFCSVPLPPPQSLASSSECAQRCFIVCVPKVLPQKVLVNVFSRFGGLIEVYMLPNKNCGYVKYSSEASAALAIKTLHTAEVYGVKLKVMEADERRDGQVKRKRYNME